MKLYNTFTRKIEEIQPLAAKLSTTESQTTAKKQTKKIGLYACGPTVYDYAHLGHLRRYTMDDVLIRALRHADFKVKYVQNVTDVGHLASDDDTGEDKLEKGARKYQQTVWDVAKRFEDYFFYSMDLMGNFRPDISCRATEHIKEQLEMVKILEQKGFTYLIKGDGVYFDTSKLSDYGKLARLDASKLKAGARVKQVAGKRNITDFALWKFEKPGENRAMAWPSPWHERSYPGWHIECSAMSIKYLGEQFEIHTGGIDHIPVHHTNEIAQAEAATGKKPFVKYWVHHNFLQVEGEKMSKSLGNFYTIDDVLERGFSPQALRLLFLGAHYKSEQNFTWKSLAGVEKAWQKIVNKVRQLQKQMNKSVSLNLTEQALNLKQQFFDFIENDLKTAEAMAVFWQVFNGDLPASEKLALLLEFDEVLGLGLTKIKAKDGAATKSLLSKVQELLAARKQARNAQNWVKSDELRAEIEKLGYKVMDREGEQEVQKI